MTQQRRFRRWISSVNAPGFLAFYVLFLVSFDALFLLGEAELGHIGWLKTQHPFDWSELLATALAALVLAFWALFDRNRKLAKFKKSAQ